MSAIVKLLAARSWKTFLNVFTTRSAIEFDRFRTSDLGPQAGTGEQAPPITNVAPLELDTSLHGDPAATEEAFSKHISDNRFDLAWDLLTPDSQESWHGREAFAEEMAARQPNKNLLGTRVRQVRLLPIWTDHESRKTYHEVADGGRLPRPPAPARDAGHPRRSPCERGRELEVALLPHLEI